MSDDDDDYFSDAKSLGSVTTLNSVQHRKPLLGLSHFTVYHSAEGISDMDLQDSLIASKGNVDKVSDHLIKPKPVTLYSQWKNRVTMNFIRLCKRWIH